MGAFDKIIGYGAIKKKLERTADVLSNVEAYRALGVRPPRALLLYGEPGVGKTLMARCLIEASGRSVVICRKDEPDGQFVKVIKKKFKKAAEKAPSILLLDDMDKFANEDLGHRDAEEYVTIQSCIDELAQTDAEVFVLATVNDIHCLPYSLIRSGRLGDSVRVNNPTGTDAEAILSHYLSNKNVVEDIDPAFLARLMGGNSCATLEEVVNEAGLLAGYDRSETITMDHFLRAALQTVFEVPESAEFGASGKASDEHLRTAYHEAGHAVVNEVLDPGSVTLAAVYKRGDGFGGFVKSQRNDTDSIFRKRQLAVLSSLGSRAALEQKLGVMDMGSEEDLSKAFEIVRELVEDSCCCGFGLYADGRMSDSEDLKARVEHATATEMERYYRKAKEVLSTNIEFLDAMATALTEKGLLTMYDIAKIKADCKITPMGL